MPPANQPEHRPTPRHRTGAANAGASDGTAGQKPQNPFAARHRAGAASVGASGGTAGQKAQARLSTVGRGAFSLSEVLVALALFTLLVVAVGQSISNNMRALAEMNTGGWDTPSMRAIREHILSRNNRQEIEDGGEIELAGWPKPGDRSNTTAAQPTKVRWTAEINPTSTLDLYTLTVDLQVDNANEPIEAGFVVHVYRPGWGRLEDRERAVEAKVERLEAIRTARGEKRKENQ